MARQTRSEHTRRTIIDAAVELIDRRGYAHTGLGDILEQIEVTKGALYHHFDSKESLAIAIIEEAVERLDAAYRGDARSAPALQGLIQGSLAAESLAGTERLVRAGTQLLVEFAKFNDVAAGVHRAWLADTTARLMQAQDDGDIRPDLDVDALGRFLVSALVGVNVVSTSITGGADSVTRAMQAWEVLLPALVPESALTYFREFLVRQAGRYRK
ncbi:ScbR family autoregulator-binding transcription factor [Mycobacterium sp. IDR2000157661]|uniref:ScbR family autoregulator-binding transcription factor n=1 Tax=Mycobacterium sp. IDR2000157661 TaxID=2867005 RepID=UPI001EEB9451|nr:ScbR family autoregulator-binding transcription factor [Mycobacterium sp. IDR2000157661]ULE32408.1 TetR/AcrR family transcriptional regulator [Mycobacterium sp. IDR2000157661]